MAAVAVAVAVVVVVVVVALVMLAAAVNKYYSYVSQKYCLFQFLLQGPYRISDLSKHRLVTPLNSIKLLNKCCVTRGSALSSTQGSFYSCLLVHPNSQNYRLLSFNRWASFTFPTCLYRSWGEINIDIGFQSHVLRRPKSPEAKSIYYYQLRPVCAPYVIT